MTEDLNVKTENEVEHENVSIVKFNDVSKAKLMTVTCPRCKVELIVNAEMVVLSKNQVICPSCLANFKLNMAMREKLSQIINPTVEVESEESKIN